MAEDDDTVECPHCGYLTSKKAIRCPRCGNTLEEKIETEEETEEEGEGSEEVEEGKEEEKEEKEEEKREKREAKREEAIENLIKIPEVGRERAEQLYDHGFEDPEDIVEEGMTGLASIYQLGFETAKEIYEGAGDLLEGETEIKEEEGEAVEAITRDIEELEQLVTVEEEKEEEKVEEKGEVTEEGKKSIEIIKKRSIESLNNLSVAAYLAMLLIPSFLLILVGIELGTVLIAYPYAYPAQTLYYLTPYPFIDPSWISSLTVSFIAIFGLFLTAWKSVNLSTQTNLMIDSKFLISSMLLSSLVSFSLTLHIFYSQIYQGIYLAYIFLGLSLLTLVTQTEILRRKGLDLITIKDKIICPECGQGFSSELEVCPNCDQRIYPPTEDQSEDL